MKNNINYKERTENINANEEIVKVFSEMMEAFYQKDRSLKIKKAREKRATACLKNPLTTH